MKAASLFISLLLLGLMADLLHAEETPRAPQFSKLSKYQAAPTEQYSHRMDSSWNLGPTGARGWFMFKDRNHTPLFLTPSGIAA